MLVDIERKIELGQIQIELGKISIGDGRSSKKQITLLLGGIAILCQAIGNQSGLLLAQKAALSGLVHQRRRDIVLRLQTRQQQNGVTQDGDSAGYSLAIKPDPFNRSRGQEPVAFPTGYLKLMIDEPFGFPLVEGFKLAMTPNSVSQAAKFGLIEPADEFRQPYQHDL